MSAVSIIATESERVAWLAKRNAAFASGGKLPGWEAHLFTFSPRVPGMHNMGGNISGRAIIIGVDRDEVEQAAISYAATDRSLYEHAADLMFRGTIGEAL